MSSEVSETEANPPRGERALYLLGLAALILVAFFMRLPGLNPRSLYFDDVWVAVLVREASLAKLIALHPHHPLGFLLLLGIGRHLGANPDLGLQILPLAASLSLVPLGALLIRQLGGGPGAGLLGAALVAVNPELASWGVRVKPYCVDAMLTLLILCTAAATLAKPSLLRLAALVVLGVTAALLSYPAILVGLVCVGVVVLAFATTRRLPLGALAGLAFGSLASYGLVYLLLLRGQANENLLDFWSSAFLPRDSLSGAASFVSSRTVWLSNRAFPSGWQGLGLLVPIGLATALWKRKTRESGVIFLLLGLAVLTASGARLYPLHARTSSFLYAPLALLSAGGVAALARGLARDRGVLLAEGGLALLALVVAFSGFVPVRYPGNDDARLVRAFSARAREEDALLVYPPANWTVGYYGSWPVRLIPSDTEATRFEVRLERPGAFTLPGVTGYEADPRRLDPALGDFVAHAPPRVLYLATHLEVNCCAAHFHVQTALVRAGYRRNVLEEGPFAQLISFERPANASDPVGSRVLPAPP